MRCKEAQKLVSEYVDGSLEERRAAELEKHLESCPDCREVLRDLESIVREARSLKTVVPPDAVWERISGALAGARLDEKARRRERAPVIAPGRALFPSRRPIWAAAAAVLVMALGGLVLVRPWSHRLPSSLTARDQYTLAKLEEAKGFYRQAIKALSDAAAAQTGTLDPKTAAALEHNLAVVDASIMACQAAVRQDPANVDNQNFLLAAYKDKVDVLTSLVDLKRESGSTPLARARTAL
jgi:anti-sigma factor RsiW